MLKSMTGFGSCIKEFPDKKITVEIKGVNHRYQDITIKLPRIYLFLEEAIKKEVSSSILRGKIDVYVQIDKLADDNVKVTLNDELAKGYLDALYALSDKFGLINDITTGTISSFSDIFTIEKEEEDKEKVTREVLETLKGAVDEFIKMRTIEGQNLKKDMEEKLNSMENLVRKIEERSPRIVAEYKDKLTLRIREILDGVPVDEARLLNEAAIYADRINVNEEIVRLYSHINQIRNLISEGTGVGRKLDFIIQELNREINTIGSKVSDLYTINLVVDVKAEIEKLREQVQNVE